MGRGPSGSNASYVQLQIIAPIYTLNISWNPEIGNSPGETLPKYVTSDPVKNLDNRSESFILSTR
jgi:hypothetical protein